MRNEKPSILLLENIHPAARLDLESHGYQVQTRKTSLEGDALIQNLQSSEVLGIRSKSHVTRNVIEKVPELITIGCFCIGTDQVDLHTAERHGIPVFNSPYSNTRSVAELVIAEIIALARRLGDMNIELHQGIWNKTATNSREVRGKVLGIVGYGHIGSQVSILAEALGMNVIYYDVDKKLPLGNSRPVRTLKELLENADFVTLHVPDTPQTRGLIGAKELKWMRDGAYLLNLSRGRVVDLEALAVRIREGKILGAAVDVYPEEPHGNGEKFETVLQGLSNVILTPHVGGSTEEAQEAIGREVVHSLRKFLETGSTMGAVNFPNLNLPPIQGSYRLTNVHVNKPGVLGDINSIVSEHGVNIAAQFLSTNPTIGYLVMDMEDSSGGEALIREIDALEASLKTRLIPADS